MKKITLVLLLLSTYATFAQDFLEELKTISEAEMKSSSKLSSFVVNPNTANYDVKYQRLELNVNPNQYFISGDITTKFMAISPMNSITFDLTNELTVSAVSKNGTPLSFLQNGNNELEITLANTVNTGVIDSLKVTYSGAPATGEDAFAQSSHNGSPIIWTLSEPFGARDWWPCKQDLNDKIENIDVYLTTPSQYTSVSNGLEMGQVTNGNGTKTTHFKHNYPIPAYLVAIAVTNYSIYTQQAGTAPNEFPIVNYIYPESLTSATNSLQQTVPIMNLYEQLFETYPYSNEKYGHAQFGWGGGMEHTTVSFMGGFSRNLIAHELAHQWFGDKVTCGTWKDIWLNEGFATYLSGLVIENLDGNASFVNWKGSLIDNITSSSSGAVYLTDSEAENVSRIFSSRLTYNKGAMVVHMLRWKLGDANFFQGLKNYLAASNLAYNYAITDDLQFHLEAVSGLDLTEFFSDWIYNQGYPSYSITAQNWNGGNARIVINQTTSNASVNFFEMPVPVRLFGSGGQILDVVLDNTFSGQQFIIPVSFTVTGLEFDPENHIVSNNNNTVLGTESFEVLNEISVYPSPTIGDVHIQMPTSLTLENVNIYNALGQKILETKLSNINISNLSTGILLLEITTDQGTILKKIIKK